MGLDEGGKAVKIMGKRKKHCVVCGMEVTCNMLKVPRKCEKCGAAFDIRINIGFLIYIIISLLTIVFILYVLRKLIHNQWVLYIISMLEIIVFPNIIEKNCFN